MNNVILIATIDQGVQAFKSHDMASSVCAYYEDHGMNQVFGIFEQVIDGLTCNDFAVLVLDLDNEESRVRYESIWTEHAISQI